MIFGGRSFSGRERHCVFLNTGNDSARGPQFANASAISGLDLDDDGRALGLVDWDFDGDLDVWISNRNAPRLRFLRNDARTENHFLALRLQGNGATCNRDAIGARVEVHFDDPERPPLIRTVHAGEGFLAQSSKWVHFGLGDVKRIAKVIVWWPGGARATFDQLSIDTHYRIVQATQAATRWSPPLRPSKLQPSVPEIDAATSVARIPLAYRLPMVSVTYGGPNGSQKRLRFDSGRPMLINLWASWCRPCLAELQELKDRRKDIEAAGIDVLALSVDGLNDDGSSADAAQKLLDRMHWPFPSGRATPTLLSAFQSLHDRQIPMRLPLPLPTSLLVNKRGQLSVIYKGPLSVDKLLDDASAQERSARDRFVNAGPLPGRTIDDPKIDGIRRRVETLIRFRLGRDLERSGQWEQAAHHYGGVVANEPSYTEAHNNLGNVLARLNRFPEAETHLRQAIALNPRFDLAHHNLGNVLLQLKQARNAIDEYEQAVQLAPDHAGYRYSLGNAWLGLGKFTLAVTCLREAIQLDNDFADAHNNLGIALERSGDTKEATKCYQRVLELNPRHRGAAANLERLRQSRLGL